MATRTGSTFSVVIPVKTEIGPAVIQRKGRLNTLGILQLILGLNMFLQEVPDIIFTRPESADAYFYMGFWSGFLHMWSGSMSLYTASFSIKRPSKLITLSATLLNIILAFTNFLFCLLHIVAVESAAILYRGDRRLVLVSTWTRGMLFCMFLFPVTVISTHDSFRLIPRKPALPELSR
ncbi:hypothetical protein RvY_17410 [Ramazzottius varieornatus]|uniref:Uncharacterized protein n=1 Tax=Ramazzottius varieornatus TaxID=947166 RepID=A0A1D1W2G5_RAMVA|nr:hypothetical protein RvY_17410 [Ramazzottius varieornatus]